MPGNRHGAGQLVPAPPGQPGAGPAAQRCSSATASSPAPWHRPSGRQSWTSCTRERFADLAPAEAWAILLDEGTYLGSESTFYRILRAEGETRERRRQATHPAAVKPELEATGPNQCWTWDITKLHGPAKWTYYQLYVILDIYCRYAVGWMVASRESAVLAEKLITDTCAKQAIRATSSPSTPTAAAP